MKYALDFEKPLRGLIKQLDALHDGGFAGRQLGGCAVVRRPAHSCAREGAPPAARRRCGRLLAAERQPEAARCEAFAPEHR